MIELLDQEGDTIRLGEFTESEEDDAIITVTEDGSEASALLDRTNAKKLYDWLGTYFDLTP